MTIPPTIKLVAKGAVTIGSAALILNSSMSLLKAKSLKDAWAPSLTILIAGAAIAYSMQKTEPKK